MSCPSGSLRWRRCLPILSIGTQARCLLLFLLAVFAPLPLVVRSFSPCYGFTSAIISANQHQNDYAMATSAFGGVSILVCVSVVMVIVAYRKDTLFPRERIILGLMMANIMFSAANVVPVQYFRDCDNLFSAVDIAWIRGMWLWGKYWMVCYEILIVGTALVALRSGQASLPRAVEVCCHVTCFAAGATAFAVWSTMVINEASEQDALRAVLNACFSSTDDDAVFGACLEAHGFSEAKVVAYLNLYARVLTVFVRVWLGPFALSLVLWVLSRVQYHALLRTWTTDRTDAAAVWSREFWSASDQVHVQRHERLFALRREAFDTIARPLEPYVAVFVLFGIPAIVISTDYCQHISANSDTFCQLPCEMVLALRSTATGLVYFWQREHRQQLWNCGELWTRLRRRVCACWCGVGSTAAKWHPLGFKPRTVDTAGTQQRRRQRGPARVAFASELEICLFNREEKDNDGIEETSTSDDVLAMLNP